MSTPHEITTLTRTDHPDPSAHPVHPTMAPADLPPGVGMVTLPDGRRTLAYTPPAPPAPAPVAQPIPRWARTTALLAPTVGAGIGAGGVGLAYAAPGLDAMSHLLWAAAGLLGAGGLAAAGLARHRRRPTPHITQHVTASGLFSRAGGTIHHQ